MTIESIVAAFEAARDQWRICDWATSFGDRGLSLCGLRADHAERLAHATSGAESKQWSEVAAWLRTIEATAAQAQQAARNALTAAQQGDQQTARASVEKACELEAAWHSTLIWEPLRQEIELFAGSAVN